METINKYYERTYNYLYPVSHTISLHHSHINTNTLFYIRLASLIYLSGIYIWSNTTMPSLLDNIIYLTMQGYFITWLYFLLTIQDYLINGFGKWGRVFPLSNNLKYYIQMIHQTALCFEVPITIIFWGFLFRLLLNTEGVTTQLIIINANLHAGPLICLAFDASFNVFQFPKSHFLLIFVFGTIYMFINLVYSLTVHIIYKPIDWTSIMSYVLCASAYLLTFGTHFFMRFIFRFKKINIENRIMQGLITEDKPKQIATVESHEKDLEDGQKQNERNYSVITQQL